MKDQDQIFKRIIELQCSINFEEIQRILKLSKPGQARRLRARLLSTNILPNLSPLQKRMDPVDTFQYLVEISEVSCFPDVSFWQADQQFEQVYWRQKFLEGHQLPRCPEFKLGPPVTTTGLLHHHHHSPDRFLGKLYSSNNKQLCVDGCKRIFRKISKWSTFQKTKSGREFKE